jgi:hypothetical protein
VAKKTEIFTKSTLHKIIPPGMTIYSFMNCQLANTKPKFPRLNLQDITNFQVIPWVLKTPLESFSKIDLQLGQKKTLIHKSDIKKACQVLKKTLPFHPSIVPNSERKKLADKILEFQDNHQEKDIWYTYWSDQTRIDFIGYEKNNITFRNAPLIFPTFLYYVQLFLAIIPLEKGLNGEDILQYYTDQFMTACQSFVELQNFLTMPHLEGDKALNKRREFLLNYFNRGTSEVGPTLWHFLGHWIEFKHQELWVGLTGEKGCFGPTFRKLLNNLFYLGFSDLTQHVEKLMKKTLHAKNSS